MSAKDDIKFHHKADFAPSPPSDVAPSPPIAMSDELAMSAGDTKYTKFGNGLYGVQVLAVSHW
jgi:hypothetical protein